MWALLKICSHFDYFCEIFLTIFDKRTKSAKMWANVSNFYISFFYYCMMNFWKKSKMITSSNIYDDLWSVIYTNELRRLLKRLVCWRNIYLFNRKRGILFIGTVSPNKKFIPLFMDGQTLNIVYLITGCSQKCFVKFYRMKEVRSFLLSIQSV